MRNIVYVGPSSGNYNLSELTFPPTIFDKMNQILKGNGKIKVIEVEL